MELQKASKVFTTQAKFSMVITVDPTTGICTSNAHGMSTGQKCTIAAATTMPAGWSATTTYKIKKIDANTFYIQTRAGVTVIPTDDGTGELTLTASLISAEVCTKDADHVVISLDSTDSFAAKVQFVGSISDDCPDFNKAQAYDNAYEYIEVKDLAATPTPIAGATGITASGTDIHRQVEMNVNHLKWIAIKLSTWTAGKINAEVAVAKNG